MRKPCSTTMVSSGFCSLNHPIKSNPNSNLQKKNIYPMGCHPNPDNSPNTWRIIPILLSGGSPIGSPHLDFSAIPHRFGSSSHPAPRDAAGYFGASQAAAPQEQGSSRSGAFVARERSAPQSQSTSGRSPGGGPKRWKLGD